MFLVCILHTVVPHSHKPVGASVTETLSADAAQVRFFPAMDPQMLSEGCPKNMFKD